MKKSELIKLIREEVYTELEIKNEDPDTLKPAIAHDANKKQFYVALVNEKGSIRSIGPLLSIDKVKKVQGGDTNEFCKTANQLYSNLDESIIFENTDNLKVVKVVDACKLDENKNIKSIKKIEDKNISLLDLANEYIAEHGDVTPEELAKGLKISLKTAKKLVTDLENDSENYYGNFEESLTENKSEYEQGYDQGYEDGYKDGYKQELGTPEEVLGKGEKLTEDLQSDLINLDKQIDTITKQIAPLQKKKADLEKLKADKTKLKADQDVKSTTLTTENKSSRIQKLHKDLDVITNIAKKYVDKYGK